MRDNYEDRAYTTIEGVPFVRLFVDGGASPVWAWDSLEYADLELPVDVERRMRAWEDTYRAGGWEAPAAPPPPVAARHRAEGALLALLLAEHLGGSLAVELAEGVADGPFGWDEAADEEGVRRSLADPAMFHANAPAADPAVAARVRWMVLHPFEPPDE